HVIPDKPARASPIAPAVIITFIIVSPGLARAAISRKNVTIGVTMLDIEGVDEGDAEDGRQRSEGGETVAMSKVRGSPQGAVWVCVKRKRGEACDGQCPLNTSNA